MAVAARRLAAFALVLLFSIAGLAWGPAAVTADSHVSCTASPTAVEPGQAVTVDARGTEADVVGFDIDGDGNYDRQTEPEFVIETAYEEPGRYEPVARADEDPDATAPCGEVVVGEPPEAVLEVSPTTAKEGESVTLDASGSSDPNGEVVEYRWDLNGDGEVDEVTQEEDTIRQDYPAGSYTPSVTVVDDDGVTDTDSQTLTVEENQPPTASFTVSPNPATEGQSVSFDASNSSDPDGDIVEYRWDFDGDEQVDNTTTTPTTETSYDAGNYVPLVTVVDGSGDTDTTSVELTVEENQPPTAALTTSPNPATEGKPVSFDASNSSDPEGNIVEYRWNFDGDEQVDETTTTPTTEHTYEAAGSYNPRVTVVDGNDGADTASGDLSVEENQPPTAEFGIDPRPGTVGQPVSFDASNSSDPDGDIVTYRWDFDGDGSVERNTTDPTTEFTYEGSGSVSPSLTVVDDGGAESRDGADLRVEEPSGAVCRAEPTSVGVDETVTLNASGSEATVVEFDTDGDGEYTRTDETDFVIEVTYAEAGTYQPVARADGEPDATAACGEVTVEENQPPTAEFGIDPRPGTVGQPVSFDASNSSDPDGDIVTYRWDFDGDGSVERNTTDPTTEFTYEESGSVSPSLTVVDDGGAESRDGADLRVEEPSGVICRAEPTSVGVDETVTLNASGSEATVVEFDTDGDGTYERTDETDLVIEVTYAEARTVTPVVRAGSSPEETAICGEVTVEENQPPRAEFGTDPQAVTVGQLISFDASNSADPDGDIVTYRWDLDGDGSVERNTTDPTAEFTYEESGSVSPSLTVVDDDGLEDQAVAEFFVEEPSGAVCRAEPTSVGVDETVTLNASDSEAAFVEFDTDGDGTYERTDELDFTVEVTYAEEGTYRPAARADGDFQTETPCGEVTVESDEPPTAEFGIDPRPGTTGDPVSFDASNSSDPDGDIVAYRWDLDGDGSVERNTTDPTAEFTYGESGSVSPSLTVVDDDGLDGRASAEFVIEDPVSLACQAEPRTVTVDEFVTLNASGSEATVVEFDANGDGTYDSTREEDLTLDAVYSEPGTYEPVVRASGEGGTTASCGAVVVEQIEVTAAFDVEPQPGTVGQTVSFDASNSTAPTEIVEYRWDFDGDGTVEETTTMPTTEFSYNESATYDPQLIIVDEAGQEANGSARLMIEAPAEETGDGLPLVPIGAGAGGVLGGLGALYYFYGGGSGGGGGGGGGREAPNPTPKPNVGRDRDPQYETGVFRLPETSGTFPVSVGFEPDVLRFRAANGARTDAMVDRTAGWGRGVVANTDDGWQTHSFTVADDAHATDQSTAASSSESALTLFRHRNDRPPARVELRVVGTTDDGFEVDATVPGDDPVVDGIRVLFTALGTDADTTVELGSARTPTAPGTQIIGTECAPDYVSLSASTAVSDDDSLWTTDRSTGLSVGQAVLDGDDRLSQVTAGVSTWPGSGDNNGALCEDRNTVGLLYQDAGTLAGRTTGAVTNLGEEIRLRYDSVYNGPHKLGSTARHPLSYFALSTERMRPAVGQFRLPAAGRSQRVDCGFEPALVELTIVPASPNERTADAASVPFGWSQGTAVARNGALRQYVVHHSVAPEEVPPLAPNAVAGDRPVGQRATDGGPGRTGAQPGSGVADTGTAALPDIQPVDRSTTEIPRDPTRYDDGRAGLWLPRDETGAVSGRSELRVTGTTASGFSVTVNAVSAADRDAADRPTVVYTAWPAAEDDGGAAAEPEPGYDRPSGVDGQQPGAQGPGAGSRGRPTGGRGSSADTHQNDAQE